MSNRYFLTCTDGAKQTSARLVHAVRPYSSDVCDLGLSVRLVKQFLVRNGLRDGARDANDLSLAVARLFFCEASDFGSLWVRDRARVLLTDMAIRRAARCWLLASESCHNWRPPSLEMLLRTDGQATLTLGEGLSRSDIHAISVGEYERIEDPTLAEECWLELAAARRERDDWVESELAIEGIEREKGTVLPFAGIFGRRRATTAFMPVAKVA